MARYLRHCIAFAAAALALAGSSGCDRRSGGKVRLGVSALRISLPVFVAQDEGIFARHGIDVELRVYETAQPMVEEIVDGRIDAGGYAANPIVMLASRGARRPPVVATALIEDREHRLSYVLARPGSGLRFPADARGRRIGVLPTAAYLRWLDAMLRAAGYVPEDVTVVPLAPAHQAQALAEGGVDMLFTNDPAATAALVGGFGVIVDDGPPCAVLLADPFDFGAFVLSGAFVADQPDKAARLIAAIDEAIERTRADPDAALRAMARYLPPEQRAHARHYPRSRYLTSAETAPDRLAVEVRRQRELGILDWEPEVKSWSPGPTPGR